VSSRNGGALRDDTRNGCGADYWRIGSARKLEKKKERKINERKKKKKVPANKIASANFKLYGPKVSTDTFLPEAEKPYSYTSTS